MNYCHTFHSFYWILMLVAFFGCSNDNEKLLSELTSHTWALKSENNQPVHYDNTIVLDFHNDYSFTIAEMHEDIGSFARKWIESDAGNHFTLRGNFLKLVSKNDYKYSRKSRAQILHLDCDSLVVEIFSYHVGGIDQMNLRKTIRQTYVNSDNNNPKFAGTWQIIESSNQTLLNVGLHFYNDNLYDFFQLKNGEWKLRNNNNGSWFSYGNVICLNFAEDESPFSKRQTSLCFQFSIEKESDAEEYMYWTYENPSMVVHYKLKKVV